MEQLSLDLGGGRSAKLSPEQEAVLATLVEEDNDAILVELCDRLEQGVCALVERRWDALSKSSSSRKKTLHATERDTARIQQLRVQYWQERAVNLADLVFVDETGSNLSMTRRYARALKGDRAYSDAPYQRGNNLTLIGAMALGLVGEMTLPGAQMHWPSRPMCRRYC